MMSGKPVRSKTGCLTCKTRRKKCDEGRPTCDRCARAKMECLGYTYLDNPEELIQARAKVAARAPASRSTATTLSFDARYQSVTPFPPDTDLDSPIARNQYLVRSHSVPSGLPSSSSTNYNAGFTGTALAADNVRPSVPNFSYTPQPMSPGILESTSSRESGWWGNDRSVDTFRGGAPHEGFASQPSPATQVSSPRAVGSPHQTFFGDVSGYSGQYASQGVIFMEDDSGSRLSSPALSDEVPYECDSESTDTSDRENVKDIACGTPSGTDLNGDALQYVLQAYANWMMQSVFDPIRTAQLTRSSIIEQFGASEESRTTLMSIANVVRSIGRTVSLDSNQVSDVGILHRRAQHAIAVFHVNEPHIYEQGTQIAAKTLNSVLEVLPIHLALSPLGTSVRLLREAALVFKRVVLELPGQPIDLPSKVLASSPNVRQYSTLDVMMSLGTGYPMTFSYDVSHANLPFDSSGIYGTVDALTLQWIHGCPEEFVILLARMHNIRDASTYTTGTQELDEIETVIRDWRPRGLLPEQPHLAVARLAINECWRQTLLIYLFMGIYRAGSDDIRVARSHKSFMKILKTIQPSRVPDMFLLLPLLVAAVASHRHKHRNKIYERARGLRECRLSNTAGNDIVAMMVHIWRRADLEDRAIFWSDVKVAFNHVVGL